MLGNKKTLPLWRPRRTNFLALERAVGSSAQNERNTDAEHTVIEQKAAHRRFEEGKGRIRPLG